MAKNYSTIKTVRDIRFSLDEARKPVGIQIFYNVDTVEVDEAGNPALNEEKMPILIGTQLTDVVIWDEFSDADKEGLNKFIERVKGMV